MNLRSPLGRARGLGSAQQGVSHFWHQRLTALGLVPLTFWFVISVILLAGRDYTQFQAWLKNPFDATLLLLTIFAAVHHGQLGIQVVIEDYVHSRGIRTFSIVAVKFAALLIGVFSAVAVFRVAFVGG